MIIVVQTSTYALTRAETVDILAEAGLDREALASNTDQEVAELLAANAQNLGKPRRLLIAKIRDRSLAKRATFEAYAS